MIIKTWTELKTLINTKNLSFQYEDQTDQYKVWTIEGTDKYQCFIVKESGSEDQEDFEDNYKDNANHSCKYLDSDKSVVVTGKTTVTGTNQDIVEYEVPENKVFYLTDFVVGGSVIDRKVAKANTSPKWRLYHQANDSKIHTFSVPLKVPSGVTITIKNEVATNGVHVATIIGVLYDE